MGIDRILSHAKRSGIAILCVILIEATLGCAPRGPVFPDSERIPAHILLPAGSPGVQDGRARFREIFCGVLDRNEGAENRKPCETYLHVLLDEEDPTRPPPPPSPQSDGVQLFFVPGLFNGCLEGSLLAYNTAFRALEARGYSIQRVPVSSFGSTGYNADRIAAAWPTLERDPARRLVLAGYSKGAPDILEFLVRYPDLAADVDAVVPADHWVIAVPVEEDHPTLGPVVADAPPYPRTVLVESILLYVGEDLAQPQP